MLVRYALECLLYRLSVSEHHDRFVRELKGFQRVTLKLGEVRPLTFRIGPDELRYWNAASRDWVIDTSTSDVAVGGDSTTPFGASFTVAKTP